MQSAPAAMIPAVEARVARGLSTGGPTDWRFVAIVAAVAIVVLSVLWMAAESHYRSCIARANAKFPAVAVSAFNGKVTGPLRVSFVTERQKAVDDCHRL